MNLPVIARLLVLCCVAVCTLPAAGQPALPRLAADGDRVTVSGLSAGAYMASQLAVAHSARIRGVGVFAGGPYYCVGINPARAEGVCLDGSPGATGSIRDAERLAGIGLIDPTTHLRATRAWLLAGESDPVVATPVVSAAYEFYAHYHPAGAQFRVQPGLGHGLPTPAAGVACATTAPPFINRCGVDLVAEMLASIDAGAAARPAAGGRLLPFAQTEFVPLWQRVAARSGLAPAGYVYVPTQCEHGSRCRIHVALHGCRQGAATIGEAFVRESGYNEWAAAHDVIVLYPQVQAVRPTPLAWWLPLNPNGCWDWWGYTGTDYAVRSGVQIRAVMAMVDRLAAPR
jgi:poly(3-hydroxybutyrate) depolymerase